MQNTAGRSQGHIPLITTVNHSRFIIIQAGSLLLFPAYYMLINSPSSVQLNNSCACQPNPGRTHRHQAKIITAKNSPCGRRVYTRVFQGSKVTFKHIYKFKQGLNSLCCWWPIWLIQNDAENLKNYWNVTHRYPSENTQWELSNEYQHDMV